MQVNHHLVYYIKLILLPETAGIYTCDTIFGVFVVMLPL
jgi:hypothetical protein